MCIRLWLEGSDYEEGARTKWLPVKWRRGRVWLRVVRCSLPPSLSLPLYIFSPLSSHSLFVPSSTREFVHRLWTQALTGRLPKTDLYDI